MDLSDNKNNDDIFIKKILKNEEKNNKRIKLSLKDLTSSDQIGENSSNKKTASTSYNINSGPKSFRSKHKSPNQYYNKWVNMKINEEINQSYDENLEIKKNIIQKKKDNQKIEAKCCSIF